jgi:hypothetical protein
MAIKNRDEFTKLIKENTKADIQEFFMIPSYYIAGTIDTTPSKAREV